jgi:hypothetical protein
MDVDFDSKRPTALLIYRIISTGAPADKCNIHLMLW